MKRIKQQFLKPGWYGSDKRGYRNLTADDLARFRDGTNAALKSGLEIPFIDRHCSPEALDSETKDDSAYRGMGWLKEITQNKDGSISYDIEATDATAVAKIEDGSIKYVSPQLIDDFRKNGTAYGSIFRHIAATATPINSDQGPIEVLSLSETDPTRPFCLSLDEYQGVDMPKTAKKKPAGKDKKQVTELAEEEDKAPETPNADEQPTNEVDAENVDTGNKKVSIEALAGQLIEATGAILPDGVKLDSQDGIKFLLTAAVNAIGANNQEEVVEDVVPAIEEESPTIGQFSENLSPTEQALTERLQAVEGQLRARTNRESRARLNVGIRGSGLPPKMVNRLANVGASVNFSETGEEEPRMTVSAVVELVKETIPPHLLNLAEDANPDGKGGVATIERAEHQDGSSFFEDDAGHRDETQQEAAIAAKRAKPTPFSMGGLDEARTVEHTPAANVAKPRRRRGRPPGSKNRK